MIYVNKRGIKTKEKIKLNFLTLIKDKHPQDLTVSELCKHTGIQRKTFYAYYRNISDILDEIFDDLIGNINSLYIDILTGAIGNFEAFFNYVNQYILKNLDYVLLSKSDYYVTFVNRVDDYFTETILNRFNNDFCIYKSLNKYDLFFLISGISALYTHWFHDIKQCPIEYISNTCISMCQKIFESKDV